VLIGDPGRLGASRIHDDQSSPTGLKIL
jgi:hypothetical protein